LNFLDIFAENTQPYFLKIRPGGAQLFQSGIPTGEHDEAKLLAIWRKRLKHLSEVDAMDQLCLGEL